MARGVGDGPLFPRVISLEDSPGGPAPLDAGPLPESDLNESDLNRGTDRWP